MKQAGCRGIYFGLETGSQRMQQVINKHLNVADAIQVVQRSAEQGLEITTSMIIGFPNEQPEDLRDSLRVFLDLKATGHALVQLHVLAPMIGSALSGEGHTLQYDGMPSDFSDTARVLDAEDRELIQGHKDIFASFWHYENPLIPRQRFLFLAHFLTLASLYFADELRTAARCSRDALIHRLIEGDIPEPFYSDSTFSADLNRSVVLTGKILNGFARPLVRGAATVVDELCGPCGRCCFEPGGILCGRDEWPEIRNELGKDADRWPSAAPLAGSELIQLNEFRDVPCSGAADGGGVGQTRRACPALRSEDRRWRCVIEGVKPAGCIAYPLKLVLREHAGGAARWLISLEFDGLGNGEWCPLEKALRSSPELLDQYREDVRRRIGSREGAFALAEYNYSQQLASRAVI
jgi:Fe-S-cluster containining protein